LTDGVDLHLLRALEEEHSIPIVDDPQHLRDLEGHLPADEYVGVADDLLGKDAAQLQAVVDFLSGFRSLLLVPPVEAALQLHFLELPLTIHHGDVALKYVTSDV
jgi:hypothetical protein